MSQTEWFDFGKVARPRDLAELWRAEYAGDEFLTAVGLGLWAPGLCFIGIGLAGPDVMGAGLALFAASVAALVVAWATRRVRGRWAALMMIGVGLSAYVGARAGATGEWVIAIGALIGIVGALVWTAGTSPLARRHSWDIDGESILED